jgi:hypothetical protein
VGGRGSCRTYSAKASNPLNVVDIMDSSAAHELSMPPGRRSLAGASHRRRRDQIEDTDTITKIRNPQLQHTVIRYNTQWSVTKRARCDVMHHHSGRVLEVTHRHSRMGSEHLCLPHRRMPLIPPARAACILAATTGAMRATGRCSNYAASVFVATVINCHHLHAKTHSVPERNPAHTKQCTAKPRQAHVTSRNA